MKYCRLIVFLICTGMSVTSPAEIDGAFTDPGDGHFYDVNEIPRYLDALQGIGINHIIFHRMMEKRGGCYGVWFYAGGYSWQDLSYRLELFMHHAHIRGMTVIVGLAMATATCLDQLNVANADDTYWKNRWLTYLVEAYWRHRYPGTLRGYYIPDEVSVNTSTFSYFQKQTHAIRAYSSLPIYVSPYLGYASQYGWTPHSVGAWAARFIAGTGVNEILLQDSVGAIGTPFSPLGEYTVAQYFSAVTSSIGSNRLIADLELFNQGYYLYTFHYGVYQTNPMHGSAASVYRLREQWGAESGARAKYTWIPQQHLNPNNYRGAQQTSKRAYWEYRAARGRGGAILPYTARYLTRPDNRYPSWGSEISNTQVGSSRYATDPEWMGFLGSVNVILDFGFNRQVDFISAHVMQKVGWGIYFPESISVRFSTDGQNWGPWIVTLIEGRANWADGEYVLSNVEPLQRAGRFVQVSLVNKREWTFLSEVTATDAW